MAMTLGDAVRRFLDQLPDGLSSSVRCRYHAAVAKHLPWWIYRHSPATLYQADPPDTALVGRTASTATEIRRHWSRFGRFLAQPGITYLTLGDALDAFVAAMGHHTATSHSGKQVLSSLRVVSRAQVLSRPLSVLDIRLARSLWDHTWASTRHRDAVRQFLRFLQKEHLVPYQLAGTKPPRQRRALQQWLAAVSPVTHLDERSTLRVCVGYYLRHLQDATNRTDQSIKRLFELLRVFVTRCADKGIEQVGDLNRTVVDEYLAFQEKERANGPSTLRSIILALQAFFGFLVEEQALTENPAVGIVSKPIARHPPAEVLTDHEAACLTTAARRILADLRAKSNPTIPERERIWITTRDIAILELLLHTGIRSGELRGLTLDQLDLPRGRIRVAGKGDHRYDVKERWVYLEAPSVAQALEQYLAIRPSGPGPWVFVNRQGNPLSDSQLFVRVRHYAQAAGVTKPVSPHRLRAYFASSLVARGIDPLALQALMGHSSLSTTLHHYVSLDEEHLHAVWRNTNPLVHLRLGQEDDHE